VSWSHRDRTQQTVTVIDESYGNIGPETGVTYAIELYNEHGNLARTDTGLTGTSYTWSTEADDCGLVGRLNEQVRVRIWAVRDGVSSFQAHDFTTIRTYPYLLIDPTHRLVIDGAEHKLFINGE